MKKAAKRVICMLSAICVAVSMLLVWDIPVQAATASSKVHIGLKRTYDSIEVKFSQGDYKIQNVKSSSKNLTCRVKYIRSSSSGEAEEDRPWGYAEIGLYAKKKGTYKVTFDVVDKNKNVTKSHSVKVYANNETGIKKVTYTGKKSAISLSSDDSTYNASGLSGSGVFKVTMNKGYTLKSITMITSSKSGKKIEKKIKNGTKITLGKYQRIIKTSADSWDTGFAATTTFQIIYKDKYTGETREHDYFFYRIPQN